jgi:hypothetical protein
MPDPKLFSKGTIEYNIALTFETCEGFAGALSVDVKQHKAGKAANHQFTDILRLPIGSTALPEVTQGLVRRIYKTSSNVIDDGKKDSITDATPGAMRSWHQNDAGFLPAVVFKPDELTGKAKLYHEYVVENKRLQNKQAKKEVDVSYTGYIEYTPCSTADSQWARIAYDYVNDRVFFTPSHYKPFVITLEKNDENFFPKVIKVQVGDAKDFKTVEGWRNPWFRVTEA